MPLLKKREGYECHSCATCRFLAYKSKHPSDTEHPEPFCPKTGINIMAHVNQLVDYYCNQWDAIPDAKAVRVFYELTGMRL